MDRGAIQKKQLIIEKAAEVFAEKGFLKVTMKDIVEACGISRGGLYRYYSSTAQIFLEAAEQEMKDKQVSFAEKIEEDATNKEVIALFLKQEKETILKGRLNKAMYEFYSENKVSGRENILHRQRAYPNTNGAAGRTERKKRQSRCSACLSPLCPAWWRRSVLLL